MKKKIILYYGGFRIYIYREKLNYHNDYDVTIVIHVKTSQ